MELIEPTLNRFANSSPNGYFIFEVFGKIGMAIYLHIRKHSILGIPLRKDTFQYPKPSFVN